MSSNKIRTRFAPSPTGNLHIGGARTALFAYLFAKHNDGDFLLRIEDTDRERFVEDATQGIIDSLGWLNILPDNINKPIIQSERLEIYKEHALRLVQSGNAYFCSCSKEKLDQERQEQIKQGLSPKYSGHCRDKILPNQNSTTIPEGVIIRMKIPKTGKIIVNDMIKGEVEFDAALLDDQVIIKSDGYPTYHLASVVDDYLMGITHVIRSDEWLPSTPKHIVLYETLGWSIPQFAHLPMVLGPDKSKLSKRHGATSVLEYKKLGYLPEALINFIAFLGWNPGTEQEIFSPEELMKEFSIEKVGKSGAIFNIEKLDWLNGYYIRQMPLEKLTELCIPYLSQRLKVESQKDKTQNNTPPLVIPALDAGIQTKNKFEIIETGEIIDLNYLKKIIALEQERLKTLSEIGDKTKYFFIEQPEYDASLLKWKNMTNEEIRVSLQKSYDIIKNINENNFNIENLKQIILDEAGKMGDRGRLLWPLRASLTGLRASPDPIAIMNVLGKEKTLKRLKGAVEIIDKNSKL